MRFHSFLQGWQAEKLLSQVHGGGSVHENNAHGTGMPVALSRVCRDVQQGDQFVSMTAAALFKKLIVQFGEGFVHFGPPAAITGFFTVRRVPWIMLWTVFSVFIN